MFFYNKTPLGLYIKTPFYVFFILFYMFLCLLIDRRLNILLINKAYHEATYRALCSLLNATNTSCFVTRLR